jgi:5,10-methylenetetrahydromethanopterin reductase
MTTVEFWRAMDGGLRTSHTRPADVAAFSREAEADGWDGLGMADSQCLYGESYVRITAAAIATERIALSFTCSNPVTRHPSIAASAIAAVNELAPGRIRFGIGRGDSAIGQIGGAPASVNTLERYTAVVRRYLHGEEVLHEAIAAWRITADVTSLDVGHTPPYSQLKWIDPALPTVPVDVFASGPRVLGVAGRVADRVVVSAGADVERIRWAIQQARSARADAGLDPTSLEVMALFQVGVSDDLARARDRVADLVAATGRFMSLNGRVDGPTSASSHEVLTNIGRNYDMTRHATRGDHVQTLTDEFIDSFAVIGPPTRCVERILEIVELGVTSFMIGPSLVRGDDGYDELVDDVLPAVRAHARATVRTATSPAP